MVAAKAWDVRLDDDTFADTLDRNPLAHGHDPAERFMAQDPGEARCRPVAAKDADVRATQSNTADRDEHILRARRWVLHLIDDDRARSHEPSRFQGRVIRSLKFHIAKSPGRQMGQGSRVLG